jgi:hypothetical protein
MSRIRYIEPPIDNEYKGMFRTCSCGCGESRPLTKAYFPILTVNSPNGLTYHYFHPQRRICRNIKKRKYDKMATDKNPNGYTWTLKSIAKETGFSLQWFIAKYNSLTKTTVWTSIYVSDKIANKLINIAVDNAIKKQLSLKERIKKLDRIGVKYSTLIEKYKHKFTENQ